MKKRFTVTVLVCALIAAAAGCNGDSNTTGTTTTAATAAVQSDNAAADTTTTAAADNGGAEAAADVMSYADFIAADLETQVVVETYVQAKQSWWEDKATIYTQNEEGAFLLYNAACSQEDYDKLTPGTKIRVTGYKAEWSGEIEIMDATFEMIDGNYVAAPTDVTSLLGTDALSLEMNKFVSFKGLTVEPSGEEGAAFLYSYDGSGSEGDDLYFNASKNGQTYTFTVESYLCDKDTDVYKQVQALRTGDTIDMEGFLYWYNGANPHITSVTVTGSSETSGVMSYDEYVAAELDTQVTVETYVQAKQGWWENNGVGNASFYTQSDDHGAYFLYNMPCTIDEYNELVPGTKIKVTGYKAEWSGEVEITDATFEIEDGSFIAEPEDVTALLGSDDLVNHINEFVAFKGMTVAAKQDANGNDVAFLYNWDGSGERGSDLYFDVTLGDNTYTFTVESYLCSEETEVYKAVEALNVGDKIDLEGFLYWYNGANPHITSVKSAE